MTQTCDDYLGPDICEFCGWWTDSLEHKLICEEGAIVAQREGDSDE